MPIVKLSATESRRLSAFLTCLVLAAVVWGMMTLSNTYNYTVKEILTFKNAPQRRAFRSLQSDTVDVTVQGTGWEMLFSGINIENRNITVDVHTLENRNFVVVNNQLEQLNKLKELGRKIVAIDPDTLYFDFTNRAVKRVPVKVPMSIGYQRRFALSNYIGIKPNYVTISGPANRIADIKDWPTDSLKLKDVSESVSRRINLKQVNDGSLVIYPKAVQVTLPVDEVTEKTLEIPVKIINHNYYNVKIFPQKVKVTFTISLGRYAETDEAFFEANADLDQWTGGPYSTLPVKLSRIPAFCKIVSVEPRNIDFIIRK